MSYRRRWIARFAFLAVPIGLGWLLYDVLPPEARWTMAGDTYWSDISDDGKRLLVHDAHWEWDKPVARRGPMRLVEMATGRELFRFLDETERIRSGMIAPGWRWWAALVQRDGEASPRLCLVDLASGATRFLDADYRDYTVPSAGALRFSPDGRLLALGGDSTAVGKTDQDGRILLFDVEAGEVIGRLPWDRDFWAFTRDGEYFVYRFGKRGEGRVGRWNVPTRRDMAPLGPANGMLALAPDGQSFAEMDSQGDLTGFHMYLWNLSDGRRLPLGKGQSDRFHEGGFSPDGRHFIMLSVENGPAVWDVGRGTKRSLPKTIREVRFMPDSRGLLVHDGVRLSLLDIESLEPRWARSYTAAEAASRRHAIDAETVAVLRIDGMLELLDAATGTPRTILPVLPAGVLQSTQGVILDSGGPFLRVGAYAPPDQLPPDVRLGPLRAWTRRILNLHPEMFQTIGSLIDVRTGRPVLTSEQMPGVLPIRTGEYMLVRTGETTPVLTCLDIPPRKPWRWVVGPPLGLGLLAVGVARWRRRKARR
jgi:hypothetical protein